MKIKNIFKTKTQVNSTNLQKLEKNQLSQIIGGGDGTTIADTSSAANKTRGMMAHLENK